MGKIMNNGLSGKYNQNSFDHSEESVTGGNFVAELFQKEQCKTRVKQLVISLVTKTHREREKYNKLYNLIKK